MKPELQSWSFAGPFGKFDPAQLQRGYQVYKEVCATCHSMKLRRLPQSRRGGRSAFQRGRGEGARRRLSRSPTARTTTATCSSAPGMPSDHFPARSRTPQAGAAANGGAAPPDLSLMAKARGVGARHSLDDRSTSSRSTRKAGRTTSTRCSPAIRIRRPASTVPEGTYYNPYFVAARVAEDAAAAVRRSGRPTPTAARRRSTSIRTDVSAFLMWAAEPHLVERKRIGFQVFIFLVVFAGLMYLTKKKVWSKVAH